MMVDCARIALPMSASALMPIGFSGVGVGLGEGTRLLLFSAEASPAFALTELKSSKEVLESFLKDLRRMAAVRLTRNCLRRML